MFRVSKYIRWQVALTFLGIVLVGAVLFYVSWGRQAADPYAFSRSSQTTTVQTRGGTYVEGLVGYPQYINPLFSDLNDVDRDLCALVFEGLTRVNEHNQMRPCWPSVGTCRPMAWSTRFTCAQVCVGRTGNH